MNNKGFSLIELLSVVLIVGIIGSIAVWGFQAIFKNANQSSLEAKKDVILAAAILYGEDNELLINNSCEINGKYADCLIIKLQELIDNNYYTGFEKCKNSSLDKCVYNDVTKHLMNDEQIVIYDSSSGINASFYNDVRVKIN